MSMWQPAALLASQISNSFYIVLCPPSDWRGHDQDCSLVRQRVWFCPSSSRPGEESVQTGLHRSMTSNNGINHSIFLKSHLRIIPNCSSINKLSYAFVKTRSLRHKILKVKTKNRERLQRVATGGAIFDNFSGFYYLLLLWTKFLRATKRVPLNCFDEIDIHNLDNSRLKNQNYPDCWCRKGIRKLKNT